MRVKDPFDEIEVGKRKAVLYTACLLALFVAYTLVYPTQVAVVAMVLTFPLMIFLHELGHFTLAKRSGMLVTEFFIGMGPRVWSFRKGETEYGIKAFPVGGYCKIVGMTNLEDIDPEDEPRTYRQQSWHAKVAMCVAGPATHFIIAIVLMFTVLFFAGNFRDGHLTTTLGTVKDAAADAHLQAGDQVIAINGVAVDQWEQVHALIAGPPEHPAVAGTPVHFVVRRGDDVLNLTAYLRELKQRDGSSFVGVGITSTVSIPHPGVFESVALAPRQVFDLGWESLKALGGMFSPHGISNYFHILAGDKGKGVDESKRFLSPVGFAQVASDAVHSGWVDAFGLLITINVFVGLLNLMPLLPFDGGHIAVATYERIASTIRRRRVQVDITKLLPITVAVVAVLGFIFVSSLFLDATRGVPNPF